MTTVVPVQNGMIPTVAAEMPATGPEAPATDSYRLAGSLPLPLVLLGMVVPPAKASPGTEMVSTETELVYIDNAGEAPFVKGSVERTRPYGHPRVAGVLARDFVLSVPKMGGPWTIPQGAKLEYQYPITGIVHNDGIYEISCVTETPIAVVMGDVSIPLAPGENCVISGWSISVSGDRTVPNPLSQTKAPMRVSDLRISRQDGQAQAWTQLEATSGRFPDGTEFVAPAKARVERFQNSFSIRASAENPIVVGGRNCTYLFYKIFTQRSFLDGARFGPDGKIVTDKRPNPLVAELTLEVVGGSEPVKLSMEIAPPPSRLAKTVAFFNNPKTQLGIGAVWTGTNIVANELGVAKETIDKWNCYLGAPLMIAGGYFASIPTAAGLAAGVVSDVIGRNVALALGVPEREARSVGMGVGGIGGTVAALGVTRLLGQRALQWTLANLISKGALNAAPPLLILGAMSQSSYFYGNEDEFLPQLAELNHTLAGFNVRPLSVAELADAVMHFSGDIENSRHAVMDALQVGENNQALTTLRQYGGYNAPKEQAALLAMMIFVTGNNPIEGVDLSEDPLYSSTLDTDAPAFVEYLQKNYPAVRSAELVAMR